MKFKVGDKVVGNASNYPHRVGETGMVTGINGSETWVEWGCGDEKLAKIGSIDLVEPATIPQPMHPDQFLWEITQFAKERGYLIPLEAEFYTAHNKIVIRVDRMITQPPATQY